MFVTLTVFVAYLHMQYSFKDARVKQFNTFLLFLEIKIIIRNMERMNGRTVSIRVHETTDHPFIFTLLLHFYPYIDFYPFITF